MILDTNAVSALLAGDLKLARVLEPRKIHELPVIVIGEYRFGLRRSRYRKSLEPLLDRLIAESTVLDVQADTAMAYAEVRDSLRRRGRPIPENDIWIAALAIQHKLALVTADQHFSHVTGLKIIRW